MLSVAAGVSYHLYTYGAPGIVTNYAKVGSLVSLFYLLPLCLQRQYDITELISGGSGFRKSFYAWNFAFFCVLAIAFLAKLTDVYSRGAVILFYVLGYAGVSLIRAAVINLVHSGFNAGWLATRRILLIGSQAKVAEFMKRYAPRRYGLQVVDTGLLPQSLGGNGAGKGPDTHFAQLLQPTIERVRTEKIDDIVLLVPWSDARTIKACTEALMSVPASVHLGPERIFDRFSDIRLCRVGPATGLNIVRPPLSPAEIFTKRMLDVAVAITGLLVLSPLFLLIAFLIKLDSPGPVLFMQRRHGFNQKPFRIFKFRTMTRCDDGPVVRQATANDARVTRIGRYLRRWNIDEMPQLLNVLRGDMSIVGPRPHAMVHNHDFERRIALYARRHNVKPGITGWAQINGLRGATETDEKMDARVEYDLYYIDNWSIWFDIYIMAMTVLSPRAFQNAY